MRQCLSCQKQLEDGQYICPACGGRTFDPAETVTGVAPSSNTSGRRWATKAVVNPMRPGTPTEAAPTEAPADDALPMTPALDADTSVAPLPLAVTGKKWRSKSGDPRQPGSAPLVAGGAPLQVEAGENRGATSSGVFDEMQRSPAAQPAEQTPGSGLFDDMYQGPPDGGDASSALIPATPTKAGDAAPEAASGAEDAADGEASGEASAETSTRAGGAPADGAEADEAQPLDEAAAGWTGTQ